MIRFFVSGNPVPKQSFKMGRGHGYTPERIKAWEAAVQAEAMRYVQQRISGHVYVKMNFYMPNNRRSDLDNLSKAVLDSAKNICFEDDSEVTRLSICKSINKETPGVMVVISEDE